MEVRWKARSTCLSIPQSAVTYASDVIGLDWCSNGSNLLYLSKAKAKLFGVRNWIGLELLEGSSADPFQSNLITLLTCAPLPRPSVESRNDRLWLGAVNQSTFLPPLRRCGGNNTYIRLWLSQPMSDRQKIIYYQFMLYWYPGL